MTAPPALVIFDCDGTLVDSEAVINQATAAVLQEAGLKQYTGDICAERFIGLSQPDIWRRVEEESSTPLPGDINQYYIDRVAAISPGLMRAAPGITSVLDALTRAGRRICVGSNGERRTVVESIGDAGLDQYFAPAQIFVAEDVPRPKPHPDLYLYAAQKMQAAPQETWVIEDSIAGAAAGIAAGMRVFGYTGLAHDPAAQAVKLRNSGVQTIIASYDDLHAFL